MSQDRHHGLLPTPCSLAVCMYIILLIIHGGIKCVTPAHTNKEGFGNYCPSADLNPDSDFYGPDCRRNCRGNCLNGRRVLLPNGRAVNCTEGCVLGWRGLTCSTRCKRPCLECDRYTGDCVGQCRDGFCGPGCLQRCQYPLSTCDKSCARTRKPERLYALAQIQGSDKGGSNGNPCTKEFGNNCAKCNQCCECLEGHYGSRCNETCIGNCQFDCDIQTGICRACKDGFRAENCSVPCSKTCLEKACERSTGACNDGCSEGHCSPSTGCDQPCSDKCPKNCDFETCKCLTSASADTQSTTPSTPQRGNILAAYWIGSILNTAVCLVIHFILCRRFGQELWNLCHNSPRNEPHEPDQGDALSGTQNQTNGNSVREDEANRGTWYPWILALIICACVYVVLNVSACLLVYYHI